MPAPVTRIGTVEGFGAMIRFLAPADMQKFFDDDIRGTAMDHLAKGLVDREGVEPHIAAVNALWRAIFGD